MKFFRLSFERTFSLKANVTYDCRSQRNSRRKDFIIFLKIILCRILLKEKTRKSFNVRDRQLFELKHEVDFLSFLCISLISNECCEITINFVRKNDFFLLNFTISLNLSHSLSFVFFHLESSLSLIVFLYIIALTIILI